LHTPPTNPLSTSVEKNIILLKNFFICSRFSLPVVVLYRRWVVGCFFYRIKIQKSNEINYFIFACCGHSIRTFSFIRRAAVWTRFIATIKETVR